jgi:hypothetical protein
MIGKKVIVRGIQSGVYFGTLVKREGQEVTLDKARNIWYWRGAASLLQLANEGVKDQRSSKFTVTVDRLVLLDVVEIVPCTDEAIDNIEGTPVWKM